MIPTSGKNNNCAPLFLPEGEYNVIVGFDTLPNRITGFPAINGSFAVVISTSAGALAGACGHKGRAMCPGRRRPCRLLRNEATRESEGESKEEKRELCELLRKPRSIIAQPDFDLSCRFMDAL